MSHLTVLSHPPLTEMACQSDYCASDLRRPVHPAGLPSLRRGAYLSFPGGGGLVSSGVGLLCSHHPNNGGLWRLRCRYTTIEPPRVLMQLAVYVHTLTALHHFPNT